jgi:two-component system chemotaxis response regulator CheY
MKIMTVDDSMTMRMRFKNIIKKVYEDAEVLEAENGKVALKQLAEHPDIKLIFLDWNMPVMNGEEVVHNMVSNGTIKNTKVVMATTEGEKSKVVQMIKLGTKGYLVKPFQPAKVIDIIKKLL